MSAELRLNLPWLPVESRSSGEVVIRRARDDVLTYDDGIALEVRVLDPAAFPSADLLLAEAAGAAGPGRVVLVAGAVPVQWRAALRNSGLSFLDVGGTAEITWPRLRVSTRRFARPEIRQRVAVPLQKGHALVAQELLIAFAEGTVATITALAERAGVSLSTASRAVAQLAAQGLVERVRDGRYVTVLLADPTGLAEMLADRSAWPTENMICGYAWGRNIWEVAAKVSSRAVEAGIGLTVTGRTGAGFLGVLGTGSPPEVRCWASVDGQSLAAAAAELGIEPAPRESSNVLISADPWRIGAGHVVGRFSEWTALVAHPIRVWCDLHTEDRGREFAAQLWGTFTDADGQRTGRRLRRPDVAAIARDHRRRTPVLRERIRRKAPRNRRRPGA